MKSRSGCFKNNILLSKQNVMWDSGQICRLKFPAPSVIMLHCERLAGRHFLTLAVLASDEPAMLACVSPLRLVRKPPYRWQTDRPSDRHGGLRRWMGVRGWNLREVQKNKGQLKVAIPTPKPQLNNRLLMERCWNSPHKRALLGHIASSIKRCRGWSETPLRERGGLLGTKYQTCADWKGNLENKSQGCVKEIWSKCSVIEYISWGALVCCHDNLAALFPCGGVSGPLEPPTWTSWSLLLWTQIQLC